MKALASRLDSLRSSPTVITTPGALHRDLVRGLALHLVHELDDGLPSHPPSSAELGIQTLPGSGRGSGHGGEREPAVDHDRLAVDRGAAR